MTKPILDTLMEAQEQVIGPEEECYECGEFSHMSLETNFRTWVDEGERVNAMICDRCLARGWDSWGWGR